KPGNRDRDPSRGRREVKGVCSRDAAAERSPPLPRPSYPKYHPSFRNQRLPRELLRLELRVELDVAEVVLTDQLSLLPLDDRAGLEPAVFVDEEGLLQHAVVFRLGTGPPQLITPLTVGRRQWLDAFVFDLQRALLLGRLPRDVVTLGRFLDAVLVES